MFRYTDFLNVMAYDLHGDWDNYTGHPSQLYPREEEYGPSTELNVVSPPTPTPFTNTFNFYCSYTSRDSLGC